ncbi:MAG: trypsin-like peptidase domain-containing protein [Armatimonadetes bacterium]|nr:trypsin-like peptidase domain-containing protein [Armatimonadota bacterium]
MTLVHRPDSRAPGRWRDLLLALLSILVLGLVVLEALEWTDPAAPQAPAAQSSAPQPLVPRGDLAADEQTTIELFNRISPTVVYITTTAVQRDFFTLNLLEIPQGTGSGFVWSDDGSIVTNFHVVQAAHGVQVTLNDHSQWQARVVGVAPDKDLAVLKVDAPREALKAIPLGSSSDLQVGQKVFAVGNPFGLDQTLTTGIISGLGREIESITRRPIQGVIQTDAAINPGNSGGPLLDSAGRLIGVNTAIYSPSGVYAGIGFAVPVDTVRRIVPQLLAHGTVQKPGLGITIAEESVARGYGLEGVLVVQVLPGGPAHAAGIRPTRRDPSGRIALGDLIIALDGQKIEGPDDLFGALDEHQPGDTVTVTVRRPEGVVELRVSLLAMP